MPTLRLLCACLALLSASVSAVAAVTAVGDVTPSPVVGGDPVKIGVWAYGEVTVDGGSQLTSSRVEIGDSFSSPDVGIGIARVSGVASRWLMQQLEVRSPLLARVEVLDGGYLRTERYRTTGEGPVQFRVSGEFSLLKVNDYFEVNGFGGGAAIEINQGATLDASNAQFLPGLLSEVSLNDGTLLAGNFNNLGLIQGGGDIRLGFFSSNSGRIAVGQGQRLTISISQQDRYSNHGQLSVIGGELVFNAEVLNGFDNQRQGLITLDDGVIRFDRGESFDADLQNDGRLASIGGVNDIHGRVDLSSKASIALTNDSVLRFHDSVQMDGGVLSVFAGSRAVFLDGLSIYGGTLFAQLPGQPGGEAFGVAEVVGELNINGLLQFSLGGAYAAQAGDLFPLVTASGGITGEPTLAAAPPLPDGLSWQVRTGANTLALAVVAGLAGDFNADGLVDAADYTVWRDGLGAAYQQSDYDLWRASYGQSLAATTIADAAPEPAALLLTLIAASGCVMLNAARTARGKAAPAEAGRGAAAEVGNRLLHPPKNRRNSHPGR